MNKIISVNIGGLVFPIDESAYDKLDAYFKALRSKFEGTEGSDEIISDIELRIAEIFQERRKGDNGAILSADIDHMIETMGKPSEYDAYLEENLSSTTSEEKSSTDPFSETTFDEMAESAAEESTGNSSTADADTESTYEEAGSTSGTGYTGPRRFFRDPDDKWLGGVCSGFAAYIGIDPLIIRAIVGILWLSGIGLVAYIALWILVPEAKTRADKMHMRGEKINIDTIEENFRREFDDLKQRFDDLTGSQGNAGSKKKVADSEDQASRQESAKGLTFGGLIAGIFTIFGKLIGFAVSIFVLFVLLRVLLGVFGGIFWGIVDVNQFSFFHFSDASNFFFSNSLQKVLVAVGVVLLVIIPIITIVFRLIKRILGMKGKTRVADGMFTLVWLLGLGMVITAGILVGREFREQASFKEYIPVKTEASTLYLDMINPRVTYFNRNNRDGNVFIQNDSLYIENVELDIIKAEGLKYDLYTVQRSRGRNRDQARRNAENIEFDVKQSDSVVFLPAHYTTGDRTWRNQKIKLILEVPEGKRIIIDEKVDLILQHVDRSTFIADRDFFNTPLVMSSNGLEPLAQQPVSQ